MVFLDGRIISMSNSKRFQRSYDSWTKVLDSVSRFDAVVGKEVADTDPRIATDFFARLQRRKKTKVINIFDWNEVMHMTNKSQLGCALSHASLWEECVRINSPLVVIEDDVLVRASRESVIDLIRSVGDCGFVSLVHMGTNRKGRLTNLHRDPTWWGTQAYYVTPKAAKLLLGDCFPMSLHIDRYIATTSERYGTDWMCATPCLQYHTIGQSTLEHTTVSKIAIWIVISSVVTLSIVVLVILLYRCKNQCSDRCK